MEVLEAARVAERMAVGAATARNTSDRLSEFEAARLAGGRGTVACS